MVRVDAPETAPPGTYQSLDSLKQDWNQANPPPLEPVEPLTLDKLLQEISLARRLEPTLKLR